MDPSLDSDSMDEVEEEEAELETAWDDWESDGDELQSDIICLFCDSKFGSSEILFRHCRSNHGFDFPGFRKELGLDFYACVKLINFIRAKVAGNECWSCRMVFGTREDLWSHSHPASGFGKGEGFAWEDDRWLQPVLEDDALLHCFEEDEELEMDGECVVEVGRDELIEELGEDFDLGGLLENGNSDLFGSSSSHTGVKNTTMGSSRENKEFRATGSWEEDAAVTDIAQAVGGAPFSELKVDKRVGVLFANVASMELKKVNDSYFGSYGSFGIHREMLSDKARMDAYSGALLKNPSLMKGATVMDVGCGTGILSLFAAKAGASKVIAVEASEKMASVAKQIIKENGMLCEDNMNENRHHGIIEVVHGMVEDLDKLIKIPSHSVDVLVSEWMGYCLLFETMLNSVLYARDHWLKPGGAILPDVATLHVAGLGRGGTSLAFWENVCGFDMSSVGKEVLEAAAHSPVVDTVDEQDIITETAVLQAFDLATMKSEEVDFTSSVELELKSEALVDAISEKNSIAWCFGVVLWFETGFTSRYCRETPTILSTSPYCQKTHWYQTIFTFSEPIAMSRQPPTPACSSALSSIGTEECPAKKIGARISIARASVHRSIDISLEMTGISADGRKHSFPTQIFDL